MTTKVANFKYKCRSCGEIYSNVSTGASNADVSLMIVAIVHKLDCFPERFGSIPEMLDTHSCKNGFRGVCDFIGIEHK